MSKAIVISSEADAWRLLERAVHHGEDLEFSHIEFRGWPNLLLHVEGPGLQGTIPGRYLGALQEYQEGLQRIYSLVKYREYSIKRLKDVEKRELEITYSVGDGSSKFLAELGEKFELLGSKAISKMTGKQIAITVCVLALMYFSEAGFSKWLESREKQTSATQQVTLVQEILESQKQGHEQTRMQMQILADALKASRYGRASYDSADDVHSKFVNSMDDEDTLHVGAAAIKGRDLKAATAAPRTRSQAFSVEGAAILTGVDSSSTSGYTISVRMDDGEVITAKIEQNRLTDEELSCVKEAVFSRKPVWVHIDGKQRHQKVLEAVIYSARVLTKAELARLPNEFKATTT